MKTNSMKSIAKIGIVLMALITLHACNQSRSYKESMAVSEVDITENFEGTERSPIPKMTTHEVSETVPEALKIIKTAHARYKVTHVKEATKAVTEIATTYGGYISDQRFENTLYEKQNRFTIKIPQAYFDTVMDSIESVAVFVEFENISTKDVTEEYVDIEARLKTKLEVKARYKDILRRNAKTVEDILATEEKLRILQEEIESAQGRLKYLSGKVAYSTIQVDLFETVEYKEEPASYEKSFGDKSKNGFAFGWGIIETIVLFCIHIWPIFIILMGLLFIFRKKLR